MRRASSACDLVTYPTAAAARFFCFRHGAARVQAVDLGRAESELRENFFIVFSKCRRALCRHFGDAMHLNGTADRRGQLAACAFERNDDVIRPAAADR